MAMHVKLDRPTHAAVKYPHHHNRSVLVFLRASIGAHVAADKHYITANQHYILMT